MRAKSIDRALMLILLALFIVAGLVTVAYQQRDLVQLRYFSETGHTVRQPFLYFFEAHGGIETFGFPLTDAYEDENGVLVQTFQRAKLQLTVRGVELAPIALILHLGDGTVAAVDEIFTAYYAGHGGESFLGRSVGAPHVENNLLVQDFERGRLVLGSDGHVRMADLGSAYLMAFPPPDKTGRAAIRLQGTPTPPPSVRVNVSVSNPTVEQGGTQTIYLYVEDDQGNPIQDAQALAILRFDRALAEVELLPTDGRGFSYAAFVVPPATPGTQVVIEMHVLSGELFMTVETAYFQWW